MVSCHTKRPSIDSVEQALASDARVRQVSRRGKALVIVLDDDWSFSAGDHIPCQLFRTPRRAATAMTRVYRRRMALEEVVP
jgi:hypothetical protein